jgi:threonylcarbamoyladenosine tRNA methylthiotransferase MtaB
VKAIKEILPLKVHIFPYSSREGTAAYRLNGQLPPEIIKERVDSLRNVVKDCSLAYKRQFLGKRTEVLIERLVKDNSAFWEGYTDNYIRILLRSNLNFRNCLISLQLKKIDNNFIISDFY